MNIYSKLDVCNLPIWQEISAANLTWSESKGSILLEIQKFLNQTTSISPIIYWYLPKYQHSQSSSYISSRQYSLWYGSLSSSFNADACFTLPYHMGKYSQITLIVGCSVSTLSFALTHCSSPMHHDQSPWSGHLTLLLVYCLYKWPWDVLSITWQYCTAWQILPC